MDKRTLLFFAVISVVFLGMNFFFQKPQANQQATPPTAVEQTVEAPPPVVSSTGERPEERFYVLESETQQLVFSNYGGALAEINLSFPTKEDSQSVVKETDFDRLMARDFPVNDQFPLQPFYRGDAPNVLQEKRSLGGYYPLLRRSMVDPATGEFQRVDPEFYAFNLLSKYPEVTELVYHVKEFDTSHLVFEARQGHRTITKTYTLPPSEGGAPYVLDAQIEIQGDRDASKGLWIGSGVPEVELLSGRPTPALKVRLTRQADADVDKVPLPKKGQTVSVGSIHPDWLSNANGFFGLIVDPLDEIGAGYRADYVAGTEVPSRTGLVEKRYRESNVPGYRLALPLSAAGGKMKFRLYAGPYDVTTLKHVDRTLAESTAGANPDYAAARTYHGFFRFITEPFSKFLWILLSFFHTVTSSWGFSIIILTVVLRLLLYPLSSWSMKSMRRMQKLAPEVAKIQAKYKKDPKRSQMEVLQLYRQKKVNPLMGCFPLLIQMPFLIGMFNLLKSTFALRGASFIPGWIDNLAAPDVLFQWSTPIVFFGTSFHLLPFLLGGVMFLQQRFSSTLPKDRSLWTDQQRQQRMMGNVMVIVFAVMFYNFPSGLNIYWLSSMALGILQQWVINRQLDKGTSPKDEKRPANKARITS